MLRHRLLAGMGTRLVNPRIKRRRRSLQRLQAHRAGNICDAREAFRAQQSQPTHRMHGLCSIQERETLFRFQDDRAQPGLAERFETRQPRAAVEHFAFTDQRQSKVRQRRQIPARADRTFLGYYRIDAPVQQFAQQLDDFQTDPTQSEREDIGSKQYHRPHFRNGERLADAASVAANKIQLQLAKFPGGIWTSASLPNPVLTP